MIGTIFLPYLDTNTVFIIFRFLPQQFAEKKGTSLGKRYPAGAFSRLRKWLHNNIRTSKHNSKHCFRACVRGRYQKRRRGRAVWPCPAQHAEEPPFTDSRTLCSYVSVRVRRLPAAIIPPASAIRVCACGTMPQAPRVVRVRVRLGI